MRASVHKRRARPSHRGLAAGGESIVAEDRARHTLPDRTWVRCDPSWARRRRCPHDVSGGDVTCTRMVVSCIRPSPHIGQRSRSMPVSRCTSAAVDSDGAS